LAELYPCFLAGKLTSLGNVITGYHVRDMHTVKGKSYASVHNSDVPNAPSVAETIQQCVMLN